MRTAILLPLLVFSFNLLFAQPYTEISCAHAKRSRVSTVHTSAKVSQNSALNNYDVKFYFLDLEADNLSTFIKGKVSITAQVVSSPLTEFVVELIQELQVDSIYFNNVKVDFTHSADEVAVTLPDPLAVDEIFEVSIFYQGSPPTSGFFSGISNGFSSSWGNQVTWTLSEPLNAKDWFPCKQVLEDKADSANIYITVPNHLKAGSNGLLKNTVALPGNRSRFEWETKYPIAYYLISMSIASYVEYALVAEPEGVDPILIQNFVYDNPGTLPAFKNDIDEVKDMIELFSELFGLYPFHEEKYGHCMAPFGGGMEHQTMTSLGFFDFGLDAHELGHQWFGDNVTCSSWQDIWLNEGFATYSEYLAREYLRSKSDAANWMAGNYENVLSQSSGSVYVPAAQAEDENRIFDGRLSYDKGSALVHMIRNIVKDEVFFDLLKSYQNEFGRKVASGEDFRSLLEFKSGMDFQEFFEDWYYGQGYPIYEIEWNHFNDSLFVEQKQITSHGSVSLFEIPLEYKLQFEAGDSTFRFTPSNNEESFQLYMPASVTSVSVDPNNWVLKKVNKLRRNNNLTGNAVITGADPAHTDSFSVYPNPATKNVHIVFSEVKPYSVTLTDMSGHSLLYQKGVYQKSELDVAELAPGLYILRIKVDEKIRTQKIKIE
jgi:aminopeptidase N